MIPRVATYRLQLREGMTLDRAREVVVPHAHRLGASHLYLSPPFAAAPGSTHGYDVVDPNAIEPELGGREAFDRLAAALRERGMGLMIDIVPNHMAADPTNAWWRDVCEWGERAAHARHFDIDWSEPLTLPILGAPFQEVLAAGDLGLRADPKGRGLELAYYDNAYPLAPGTYRMLSDALGGGLSDLADIADRADPGQAKAFHRAMHDALSEMDAKEELAAADADLVGRLHEAQPYRMTHWIEARRHLSYRRFFEVTGLVGLRVEDEAVFRDAHRLILELVRDGAVDGLRVDHVDGLADPTAYLDRLREAAPEAWIVVEKITEGHERLPREWPIEGTTGYEFIASMDDLLVAPEGLEVIEDFYTGLSNDLDVAEQRDVIKRRTVTRSFEGELHRVADALGPYVDPPAEREALAAALAEIIVAIPVYRTYGAAEGFREDDWALLRDALDRAAANGDGALMARALEALGKREAWEARARFQQLSGPAMAKAVEDTLFYRYNALIARNEVGCDPIEPPRGVDGVHAAFARRAEEPYALSATATHDTKRGEGARARLYTLAEAPGAWIQAFDTWRTSDGPRRERQWLFLQALAGTWPSEAEPDLADLGARFEEYVAKALREAKRRTSWIDPDEAYEARVTAWAQGLLSDAPFVTSFQTALAPYVEAGHVGTLVQTVLKVAAPGVPDIYQGTEAEDLSLVDPDNRRIPPWERLEELIEPGPVADAPPDRRQALVLRRALAVRAERPELFTRGEYRPLPSTAADVFAFERRLDGDRAVAVVPTRPLGLVSAGVEHWGEAALDAAEGLRSRLADDPGPAPPRVAELLSPLPVALLTSWS